MGPSRMEERHERLAATERADGDTPLRRDDVWHLLGNGELWKLGGIEWLLDWIETRREGPR